MMNTFMIVNITPTCKTCLEDMFMLFHYKKAFLLPLVWPGTEYNLGTHLKEELTNLFC